MPLLEAANRLGQGPHGEWLIAALRKHAPTWLLQLPALLHEDEQAILQRQLQGMNRERMLREAVEARAEPETPPEASTATSRGESAQDSQLLSESDGGELLDPQAQRAYRQRMYELQTELAEAQAFHDLGRAERLQDEFEFLSQELSRAVGLGGRPRRAGSAAERARIRVTRAIRTAIKRLSDNHPELGRHLARTVRTGTYCVYTADLNPSHSWQG